MVGLTVPDDTFTRARTFLKGSWDQRRGAFRYSHDPSRLNGAYSTLPGSTPASLFALALLGEEIDGREYATARRFVMERAPADYRAAPSNDEFVYEAAGNLYFWYYGTLAMFRVGGPAWETWNEAMKGCLLPSQQEDGSWQPISYYGLTPAGDDNRDRSYTTAMNVLSLEVYYRYFTPLLKVD